VSHCCPEYETDIEKCNCESCGEMKAKLREKPKVDLEVLDPGYAARAGEDKNE